MRISDWSSDVCSSDLLCLSSGGNCGRYPLGIIAGLVEGRYPATIVPMNTSFARLLMVLALLLPAAAFAQPQGDASVPLLPAAVSNNAVAGLSVNGETRLYSFLGLGSGKQWRDISRAAYGWRYSSAPWTKLPPVPVSQGRLASVAAVAGGDRKSTRLNSSH